MLSVFYVNLRHSVFGEVVVYRKISLRRSMSSASKRRIHLRISAQSTTSNSSSVTGFLSC